MLEKFFHLMLHIIMCGSIDYERKVLIVLERHFFEF